MKLKKIIIISLSILIFSVGSYIVYNNYKMSNIEKNSNIEANLNVDAVSNIETGKIYAKEDSTSSDIKTGILHNIDTNEKIGTLAEILNKKIETNNKYKESAKGPFSINEAMNIYKKSNPEEDRNIAITLTYQEFLEDVLLDFKTLNKYNGQYIKIEGYKIDKLDSSYLYLNSYFETNLESNRDKKYKIDFNFEFPLDYTDSTTLNYVLNKGDKINIEGKFDKKGFGVNLLNNFEISMCDGCMNLNSKDNSCHTTKYLDYLGRCRIVK